MPELPEVEITKRGIEPFIINHKVTKVIVRFPSLRWPIPKHLSEKLQGRLLELSRRGKYLLFNFPKGTLIVHLGMSGKLNILKKNVPAQKHDHVDIIFDNGICLRMNDPRRFGAVLWSQHSAQNHALIKNLGVEPLSKQFNTDFLYKISRLRKVNIKTLLMNSNIVVGIGNIYATESLYKAGIRPNRIADTLTQKECKKIVAACRNVLKQAIRSGGTTLKDFANPDGNPGYFSIRLQVYGRSGEPCFTCGKPLRFMKIAQRSTVFCEFCQK